MIMEYSHDIAKLLIDMIPLKDFDNISSLNVLEDWSGCDNNLSKSHLLRILLTKPIKNAIVETRNSNLWFQYIRERIHWNPIERKSLFFNST